MSNLLKSKFFLGALVVAVMFVGFVAVATPASADCAATITSTLKVGSSGAQVSCLQTIVGATADGAFGPMTKASVMAWQSGHGLVADGVVGPMTRAALMGAPTGNFPAGCTSASGYSTTTGVPCNTGTSAGLPAGCSTTAGYSPTTGTKCDSTTSNPTGPLTGTGEISDINQLSQYSAEEVGDGSKDVKVLGFDVEASQDGDIRVNSIKLTFDSTGNNAADSDRIDDYLSTLKVWVGSTEVGSANLSDFNKDDTGIYSKTITLNGAVVKADMTEKFYVSVDAASNLDSGDIDSDSLTIAINSLRVEDGTGVVTTVDSSNSLLTGNMDYDAAGDGVSISFVTFSSAADTELKLSTNSTPDSGVVKVNASSDTDDVTLLKGKFKLEGTSAVWLDELPVTLTSTGDSIDALARTVTLTIGSEEFTESLGANCATSCATQTTDVVTFDNLDLDLAAGSTTNFTVTVDLNDIENTGVTATDFDEGDTLLASVTTTNRGAIVAENAEGDQLTDSTEMTGSATGNAQGFYSTGIQVSLVSVTNSAINVAQVENQTDNATTTFTYDVTAFGADIYVDGTVTEDGDGTYAAGQGNSYYITRADTGADAASLTTPAASLTTGSGTGITTATSASNTTWKVIDGTTARFVLSVNVANTLTGDAANDALLFQTAIKSIGWDTSAIAATANNYTFDLEDFKNTPVLLGELDAA